MKRPSAAPLLVLILLGLAPRADAQGQDFRFQWYGFVNPHYYADSRNVVGGREEMMLFYPKPVLRDSLGNDLNSGWQSDMLAITARLGVHIHGPKTLGASTGAHLEGDFTGATNATIDNLRLRHAYIDLLWSGDSLSDGSSVWRLLMGQFWYPMMAYEIIPMTNPLNMGAPFALYARQPQVRLEYRHNYHWVAQVAASWQLDNMSQGLMDGSPAASTQFARHSMLPELTARLQYEGLALNGIFLGAGANLRSIQPVVPDPSGRLHRSFSWTLYGSYNFGHGLELQPPCVVKVQALLNNSLYEGCSLGGYMMLDDGSFRDWHFNTLWIDIARGRGHWRPGLFMGYARNTDYGNADYACLFGRGHDIEYLWRLQPRLSYTTPQGLSFVGEAEYTYAHYDEPVGNLRLSFSVVYAFQTHRNTTSP